MESNTHINQQTVTDSTIAMGGDITQNIYHNTLDSNPTFSAVELHNDAYSPLPLYTAEVLEKWQKKRVLIIKGNNQFDLASFARQLTHRLKELMPHCRPIELVQNEENSSITEQLKKRNQHQIIILNDLHPRHIQYDFSRLVALCEAKQSYYIILTETSQQTWSKAGSVVENFWYSIPEQDLYDETEVEKWFIELLADSPPLFFSEETPISNTTLVSESKQVQFVLRTLLTPQKLRVFLSLLKQRKQLFSDTRLQEILANINSGPADIISKWFHNLTHDQKVIAICAAIFNGLFCHQYFELLTTMSGSSFWKESNGKISALDYHDLDFLSAFFRYEPMDEGDLLVTRNSSTRVHLIRAAIDHYPRHIEKALIGVFLR